ncbi:MAG: hypothetical protein R3C19_18440 [Planctomycetaceae bacterium]
MTIRVKKQAKHLPEADIATFYDNCFGIFHRRRLTKSALGKLRHSLDFTQRVDSRKHSGFFVFLWVSAPAERRRHGARHTLRNPGDRRNASQLLDRNSSCTTRTFADGLIGIAENSDRVRNSTGIRCFRRSSAK